MGKSPNVEMALYGILSYPKLHNPKPYKGKIYYSTDILFDQDDAQLSVLKKKINAVRVKTWGKDKTEWPEKAKKRFIQDGNEREDQPTYADRSYIAVSTQQPVSVITPSGKSFNAQLVRGGMKARVVVSIVPWDNEGDEGLSVYLQGIIIDPTEERLPGFGGGKSAKQLLQIAGIDDEDADDDEGEDAEDEDEDLPRSKKGKNKKAVAEDDEEESEDDEEDSDDEDLEDNEDEEPPVKAKSKKKKKAVDEDDED